MAYDAADGYVVAVAWGGPNGTLQTWTFSSGAWNQLNLTGGPPSLTGAQITYDSRLSKIILFGGSQLIYNNGTGYYSAEFCNDTWTYSGGVWTNVTSTRAPPPRLDGHFIDDVADGYDVLFGGYGPGVNDSSTWRYNSSGWAPLTPAASSPPTTFGSAAYDALDGDVLYFGGSTSSIPATNQTWMFRAGTWTNRTSVIHNAPSPRLQASLEYNPVLREMVLFGGDQAYRYGPWFGLQNDSYAFSNGTWRSIPLTTAPSPRAGASLIFDPANQSSILFGGWYYKPLPGGGSGGWTELGDTWVFNSSSALTWVRAAPLRLVANTATLPLGGRLTLDALGVFAPLGSQFAYSGLPPGCAGGDSSHLSCVPNMTGNFPIRVDLTSAYGLNASANLTIQVVRGLAVSSYIATPNRIDLGQSFQLNLNVVGSSSAITVVYSGLPIPCRSTNALTLQCTPSRAGNYSIQAAVTNATGSSTSASTSVSIAPALTVQLAASTVRLEAGDSVSFVASAAGGTPPFQFLYAGLPDDCGVASTATVRCWPNVTGSYTIQVSVQDGVGNSNWTSVNLLVAPHQEPSSGGSLTEGWGANLFGSSPSGSLAVGAVLGAIFVGPLAWIALRRRRLTHEGRELMEKVLRSPPDGAPTSDLPKARQEH